MTRESSRPSQTAPSNHLTAEMTDETMPSPAKQLRPYSGDECSGCAALSQRVQAIERWQWFISGGIFVGGYLLGHLEILKKLFL